MAKMKKKNKVKKINNIRLLVTVAIFVIFTLFGIQVINSTPKLKEAIVLATTRKPETFTELYFEDHTNLPNTITRWKQYSFVFTLHNLEYQDMDYSYEVYLQRDDQKIVIEKGELQLRNDEFKSVEVKFGPLKNIRSKVVVELTNKNQPIHFWMEAI